MDTSNIADKKFQKRQKLSPLLILYFLSFLLLIFIVMYQESFLEPPPQDSMDNTSEHSSSLASAVQPPTFKDSTFQAGLDFVHTQGDSKLTGLNETLGSGACAFDYNNDGWADIFAVGGPGQTRYFGRSHWWQTQKTSALYQNQQDGTFINVTEVSGLSRSYWGMGCVAGDLDNDGDQDLLVTTLNGFFLYRNNGNGRFSDITQQARLDRYKNWSTTATLADYDRDGLLDIYIVNFINFDKTKRTFESFSGFSNQTLFFNASLFDSEPNILLRNLGNLQFEDKTQEAGVEDASGRGLFARWADINNDQWPDLFVVNDNNSPNVLFINQGNGLFEKVSSHFPINHLEASHSLEIADYNGDGRQEILLTNAQGNLPVLLVRDNPPHQFDRNTFSDKSISFFDDPFTLSHFETWASASYDFNHDGYQDVFLANGLIHPDPDTQRVPVGQNNLVLINQAGRGFISSDTRKTGLSSQLSSRGAAFADYDNDGDIDVFINNNNDLAEYLTNTTPPTGNWLKLKLVNRAGNREAIGAKIYLHTNNRTQFREVSIGSGFLSSSDTTVHFGIAEGERISQLEIVWPQGNKTRHNDLSLNNFFRIFSTGEITPITVLSTKKTNIPLQTKMGQDDPKSRAVFLNTLFNEMPNEPDELLQSAAIDSAVEVRLELLNILNEHKKTTRTLKTAIRLLDDPDITVRIEALRTVASYEDEHVFRLLLSKLESIDEPILLETLRRLSGYFIKEEAVVHRKFLAIPYLIKQLQHASPDIVIAAINALGHSESYRALDALLPLLNASNHHIQARAARSLGMIRERAAINPLVSLAKNQTKPSKARAQALIALKRLAFPSLDLLFDSMLTSSIADTFVNLEVFHVIDADRIDGVVINKRQLLDLVFNWVGKHRKQITRDINSQKLDRFSYFLLELLSQSKNKNDADFIISLTGNENNTVRRYAYQACLNLPTNLIQTIIHQALTNESNNIKSDILLAMAEKRVNLQLPPEIINKLMSEEIIYPTILYIYKTHQIIANDTLVRLSKNTKIDPNTFVMVAELMAKHGLMDSMTLNQLVTKIRPQSIAPILAQLLKPKIFLRNAPFEFNLIRRIYGSQSSQLFVDRLIKRREFWAIRYVRKIILESEIAPELKTRVLHSLANENRTIPTNTIKTALQNGNAEVAKAIIANMDKLVKGNYSDLLIDIVKNKQLNPYVRQLAANKLSKLGNTQALEYILAK